MPVNVRKRSTAAALAEPLMIPLVPFSLDDCTLLTAATDAEIAAHAAHVTAHPTARGFWQHAPAADWMLDLLRNYWQHIPVVPERELRGFALACAENLQGLAGEGLRKLLEVVRRRSAGSTTLDQLSALQRSLQPSVAPGGVQGLPRCSPPAAAALAAWHTADRSPFEAAFWAAEFAALHDAFVKVRAAAAAWEWPDDRGEPWRASGKRRSSRARIRRSRWRGSPKRGSGRRNSCGRPSRTPSYASRDGRREQRPSARSSRREGASSPRPPRPAVAPSASSNARCRRDAGRSSIGCPRWWPPRLEGRSGATTGSSRTSSAAASRRRCATAG